MGCGTNGDALVQLNVERGCEGLGAADDRAQADQFQRFSC